MVIPSSLRYTPYNPLVTVNTKVPPPNPPHPSDSSFVSSLSLSPSLFSPLQQAHRFIHLLSTARAPGTLSLTTDDALLDFPSRDWAFLSSTPLSDTRIVTDYPACRQFSPWDEYDALRTPPPVCPAPQLVPF